MLERTPPYYGYTLNRQEECGGFFAVLAIRAALRSRSQRLFSFLRCFSSRGRDKTNDANSTPLLVPDLGISLSNLWFIQVTEQVIHRRLRNAALVAMKGETFATTMLIDTGSHKLFFRLPASATEGTLDGSKPLTVFIGAV